MSFSSRWLPAAVAAALVLAAPCARAQVRLLLRFEHESYLQFETVNAYVSVYNDTDAPLCIGGGSSNLFADLAFLIEQRRDDWLPKRTKEPLVDGLVLEPGEDRDLVVDVSRAYEIATEGRYQVRAVLRDKGKLAAASPSASFDVVRGLELERVERAVPGEPERLRAYSVRYWRRNRNEFAFLSVDEEAGKENFGLFQLGKIVRSEKPSLVVTRDGMVTVRHLCAPDCFVRTMFISEADGVRFVDQRYEAPDGTPYPDGPARRRLPLPLPVTPR